MFHFGSIQFSSLRRCWILCVVHYVINFTSSKCENEGMALTPSCKGLCVDLGLDQSCTRIYTCKFPKLALIHVKQLEVMGALCGHSSLFNTSI